MKNNELERLRPALLKIFSEMAKLPDIMVVGQKVQPGLIDFNLYLKSELAKQNISAWARHVIRTMEIMLQDPSTPDEIRRVVGEIFLVMDSRDQNYRWGDCHCASCQYFANPTPENFEKALKSIGFKKKA